MIGIDIDIFILNIYNINLTKIDTIDKLIKLDTILIEYGQVQDSRMENGCIRYILVYVLTSTYLLYHIYIYIYN